MKLCRLKDEPQRRYEVIEDFGPKVQIAPEGGGFIHTLPRKQFDAAFEIVPDNEIDRPYRKAWATGDWIEGRVACWWDGSRWNGWGVPMFEFEAALAYKALAGNLQYDPERDRFFEPAGEDDEGQDFCATTIDTPEGPKKVYQIGDGWCWECEFNDNDEDD